MESLAFDRLVTPGFIIDTQHRIIAWNRALEKLTNIPKERVIGTSNHWKPFYKEARPCLADLVVEFATQEQLESYYADSLQPSALIPDAYEAEDFFPECGKQGEWLHFAASRLLDDEGNLLGALETFTIITDRIDREKSLSLALDENRKLLEHNTRLTFLLEAAISRADLYLYEENLATEDANSVFVGDDPFDKPMVGSELLARIPEEFHPQLERAEAEVGSTVEFPIQVSDERQKWVRHSVIQRFERDGQPWRYAMSMDITEIVKQREDLKRLLAENEDALLAKNKAIEELQSANRKRNQMYGIIAHELRTPASTIHMLGVNDSDQSWVEHRSEVVSATNELLHSIDDMRMIVNPDLKRPLRRESFTIPGLAKSIDRAVASTISSTKLKYRSSVFASSELSEVTFSSDLYRIKVAVTNLVRNACLHSGGTTVELELSVYRAADPDQITLEVVVRDDGQGIEQEQSERLFDPFVRGNTGAEGTGLGLHIARSWIEELDGYLKYNPIEVGSEFELGVPITMVRIDPSADPVPTDDYKTTAPLEGMRILFVEDELMLRMIGGRLLTGLGAQVDLAENGEIALEMFATGYDLVLTDYYMPEKDGEELIREIRDRNPTTPIIAVTAATLGDQAELLKNAGANYVMHKPLTTEGLLNALLRVRQ